MCTSSSNYWLRAMIQILALVAPLVLFGSWANAQVLYGSVVGSVSDPSGAVVPAVNLTLTESQTGISHRAKTNSAGYYSFADLPLGTYTVMVGHSGFRDFTQQGISVLPNSIVRVNVQLRMGDVAETVEVSGAAAQLQTDSAQVQQDITSQEYAFLPQPTYNYQAALVSNAGVGPPGFCCGGGTNNPGRNMSIEANGTSWSDTDVRIEGVSAVNPWVQMLSTLSPSVHAIENVNMVTAGSGADQTLAGGTTVNVTLKSGTNAFHGDLYWNNENSGTKARPYFQPVGTRIPLFIDNNFGGDFGGPIIRKKLFFFVSYEQDITRNGGGTFGTVPTDAVRQGIFTGLGTPIFDPATGDANGNGKTEFLNDIIPASRIPAPIQQLVALIPEPNVTTTGGSYANNYFGPHPNNYGLKNLSVKVDWNLNQALKITGRISYEPYQNTQVPLFGPILGDAGTTPNQHGNMFGNTIAVTYVVRPNLIIDGSFGLTRTNQLLVPIDDNVKYGADILHIPGVNLSPLPAGGGLPTFNISGYQGYGYGYPYLQYLDPVFQYSANTTWVKGPHTLKFGVNVSQQHMNHIENNNDYFNFNGGATASPTGPTPNPFNSYADFLLGAAQGEGNSYLNFGQITLRNWEYALYASDKWDLNKKLTVNYGLGWVYFPIPKHANHGIENFVPTPNQDAGVYKVCGEGGIPVDCGIKASKHLFQPSLGFAFRPQSSLVVRGGYALKWEQQDIGRNGLYGFPEDLLYQASSTTPFNVSTYVTQGIPITKPVPINTGYLPISSIYGTWPAAIPLNLKRGYVQNYNFTVEKSIADSWIARIGYVGTHTVHQLGRSNGSYGTVGGGTASEQYINTLGTAGFEYILPQEAMHYNALQANLQHRFKDGYLIDANYTWSKWMGVCCDDHGDGNPAIAIPQYFHLNYAVMPADITHSFHLRGVADLPFGNGRKFLNGRVGSAIAGGWKTTLIFTAHTGQPFTVTDNGVSLNAPFNQQTADRVKTHVAINHNPNLWFDPTAFAPVTAVRFGTSGFDSVRGPGLIDADVGILRDFKIGERYNLEFRAEAFNLTNTPHFGLPNANVDAVQYGTNPDGTPNYNNITNLNGFGEITSVNPEGRPTDERNFRLGLKLMF